MPLLGKRKLTQKKLDKIARLPCLQYTQIQYLNYGIDINLSRLAVPHAFKVAKIPITLATFSAPASTRSTSWVWPSVRECDEPSYLLVPEVKQEIEDNDYVNEEAEIAAEPRPLTEEPICQNVPTQR